MKTKILILVSLLLAGMIFTSCQKDNSLMPETSFRQTDTVQFPSPAPLQGGNYDLFLEETGGVHH